ncbi:MAG: class I SAM-dependent rRNA methyltransferase [Nitrospirota bacterium]|nr:class I SAM-dependent rRNA methyltransferase [Nitrospirota bacterium]
MKRTKRLLGGHLWVFSNEIYESVKHYSPGSLVEVCDMHDLFLGTGYINPQSLISVRLLTREKEEIDEKFIRRRIKDAVNLRERLFGKRDAFRLFYSEGDYLPGLIVDKYADCLVLQFLTAGAEAFRDIIIRTLDELVNPGIMVLRNESRMRTLEGLPLHKEVIKGDLRVLPVVREDGLLFEIDPYEGQKTGFFLDQRENRVSLKKYVSGGRGLDLFCYLGAWSMHLASAGAEVIGVDASERAVVSAKRNAELNGLGERSAFVKDDVFSFLERELESAEKKYDFIVLDPPAFVKSASKIKEAIKAYRELNEMSMKLIKPGGMLATSSCSYHLSKEIFGDMLHSAGRNAKRSLRLLEMRSQSPDHPVLLSMPETEYLKCAFLIVD